MVTSTTAGAKMPHLTPAHMQINGDDSDDHDIVCARVGGVQDRKANLEKLLLAYDMDQHEVFGVGRDSGEHADAMASHEVEETMNRSCVAHLGVERGPLEATLVHAQKSSHLPVESFDDCPGA